ncbi:MAG: CRISPR-associated endoribonuclease Cas6, partial [Campylobacterota bacterium]|nr:CRISPR-associated endoribonuclease Cas6 [Campylobacterota bacterium]
FYYEKGAIKAWYGVYEIKATEEMIEMILDTGLGAHAMQGLGFVEVVK